MENCQNNKTVLPLKTTREGVLATQESCGVILEAGDRLGTDLNQSCQPIQNNDISKIIIHNMLEKENSNAEETELQHMLDMLSKRKTKAELKLIDLFIPKHKRPLIENLKNRIEYCDEMLPKIKTNSWGYCPWGNCAIKSLLYAHCRGCPFKDQVMRNRIQELEQHNKLIAKELESYKLLKESIGGMIDESEDLQKRAELCQKKIMEEMDEDIIEAPKNKDLFCPDFYHLNHIINIFGEVYNNCLTRSMAYLEWLPVNKLYQLEYPLKNMYSAEMQHDLINFELYAHGKELVVSDIVTATVEDVDNAIKTVESGIVTIQTKDFGHSITVKHGIIIPVSNWPDFKWRHLGQFKKGMTYIILTIRDFSGGEIPTMPLLKNNKNQKMVLPPIK